MVEEIESGRLIAPVAVISTEQSDGIGSRKNSWVGGDGNFFVSFAVDIDQLPEDLSLGSASIYFSFIMKKLLLAEGERVWLKWPNDLYLEDKKVGGTITKKVKNSLVCGIGVNLQNSQNSFKVLNSDISAKNLLEKYLKALEKFPKWKQIFREYQIEFERSREFYVHIKNSQISLQNALLYEDGSLLIEGKRVFSLR